MWFHVFPLAGRGADLQCGDRLAEEEREASKIGVPFHPYAGECLIDGGGAAVVFHVAEVTVAVRGVAVYLEEVVFGEFEDDCDQGKEFVHDGLVDVFAEFVDRGPSVKDYLRVWAVVRWDRLGDVIDFRIVEDAGSEFADAFWLIAIVPAIFEVSAVLKLFLSG